MKPLYLTPNLKTLILLDGPSLLVETDGIAPARFPLRLVSMVVSAGPVQWTQEAMIACLQRRVPVTFLAGRGDPVGTAMPAGDPLSNDHWRIEALLASRDRLRRYQDWARSQERKSILRALKILHLTCHDLRAETVHSTMQTKLETLAPRELATEVVRWFSVALKARLDAVISRQQWCPHILTVQHPAFQFLRDAEQTLRWTAYTDSERLLRQSARQRDASWLPRSAVFAEAARLAARDQRRIEEHLDRFRIWLGGLQ